ncbi:MAG TPA: DUF3179 domain-containing (seleno)protein [Flavisolibacter sp.]|nr:DUF3179 domain-containing (seleno)protein [Flavisolibacter sp.]
MKKIFWFGLIGILAFEIANVFFIMPMPGSQRMNSIKLAYFLYNWRWLFRILFLLMIVAGFFFSIWRRKWLMMVPLLIVGAVIYLANFRMAADHMFLKTKTMVMASAVSNQVDSGRLVLRVEFNGHAKAYPIQFLGYHHQVMDTLEGKPIMITYCTVCRSGRVFAPIVNGRQEVFRLVGMDHFNAMFEDQTTRSWWRQEDGEAIAGKLKGQKLPEVFSRQTSLAKWLRLYPNSLIMQPDSSFINSYDSTFKFENGTSTSALTGTDSASWKDKSWVVGVQVDSEAKAYDWNRLKKERIIHDKIGSLPVVLVLADDDKSFFAFERNPEHQTFRLTSDTLVSGQQRYRLDGRAIDTVGFLRPVPAYQEFWHSWKTFHPNTRKY